MRAMLLERPDRYEQQVGPVDRRPDPAADSAGTGPTHRHPGHRARRAARCVRTDAVTAPRGTAGRRAGRRAPGRPAAPLLPESAATAGNPRLGGAVRRLLD